MSDIVHGFDLGRFAHLDAMLHKYVDSGRLPGTQVLVSRFGEVVHRDVYGLSDVEAGSKVAPDTIYRIYSMTKPITSVATMMLVESGDILLDNPLSRFLPEFAEPRVWAGGSPTAPRSRPAMREITILDLLTHTAGFTYGFQFQHPVDAMYRERKLGDFSRPTYDLAEAMSRLAAIPLLFDPGTRWNYSMATDVLGRVVEVASGEPLDEFFQRRILSPLGMVDTGFTAPEEHLERCCPLYMRGAGSSLTVAAPAKAMTRPDPLFSGGGGLLGTADDYLRFAQMLLNRGELDGVRLLGSRTVDYMASNHLPGGLSMNDMGQSTFSETVMAGHGFGLGLSVVLDPAATGVLGAPGTISWGGAASTTFWVDSVEQICCVFMTQLLPSDTYPVRQQLRNAVYQALID
jgi:CubicO group peptidase (beta-lactamase class C family)